MTEAIKIIKDKSTLAKLLAGEDLNVVYNKVETASFDVKSRTLTLPVLKDVSEDVMDLLTLHEVGHALYTPLEMLDKAKNTKIPFGIVNILEDVRIEKMIQDKYLGAVRNFKKGYAELLDRDFFKLEGRDINSYSLVDRINLKAKHVPNVPFTDDELVWWNKAQECKTYEDVMTLAESLYSFMEDNKPETDTHMQPEFDDSEELDNTEESTIPSNISGESSEEKDDKEDDKEDDTNASSTTESNEDKSEEKTEEDKIDRGVLNDIEMPPSDNEDLPEEGDYAETDKTFGTSFKETNDENAKEVTYVNIPKIKDTIIRSGKQIVEDMKKHMTRSGDGANGKLYQEYCAKTFAEFRNTNKKTVAYMVKEFEMKKAADQYARASVAKTGALNMDVVHQYKFNDDLFNRVTSMPDAKSHGLVMYLDWSGSMWENIHATMKQLVTLTMFCDAVQIPYRVYAFTDGFNIKEQTESAQDPKIHDISLDILDLLEFASSENTKKEQLELFELVWQMTMYYDKYEMAWDAQRDTMGCFPVSPPNEYRLCGTPLNHAIVAGMSLIPKFKKQYGLQKVQLILLTDGASHDCNRYYADINISDSGEPIIHTERYRDWYYSDEKTTMKTTIKDPDSGYQMDIEPDMNYFSRTQMYLALLKKKVPGLNVINFHLVNTNKHGRIKRNTLERQVNVMYRHIDSYSETNALIDKLNVELRKNNSASIKSRVLTSIDAYFILPGGVGLDTDQEDELEKIETGATKAQLRKAFVKSSKSKKINRPLLNEFMSLVA